LGRLDASAAITTHNRVSVSAIDRGSSRRSSA
jgi:hypothetical protein